MNETHPINILDKRELVRFLLSLLCNEEGTFPKYTCLKGTLQWVLANEYKAFPSPRKSSSCFSLVEDNPVPVRDNPCSDYFSPWLILLTLEFQINEIIQYLLFWTSLLFSILFGGFIHVSACIGSFLFNAEWYKSATFAQVCVCNSFSC